MSNNAAIGGQAVLEGVMMRGPSTWALAVRKPDGEIAEVNHPINSVMARHWFFRLPIVRGVVAWLFLVGIVGLPYWVALIPLQPLFHGMNLRGQLENSPALWFTFGSLAAGHLWKAFQSGYDLMPEDLLNDFTVPQVAALLAFLYSAPPR